MKPAGPRGMVWVTPFSALWIDTGPARVCTAPEADHHDPGQEGDREQDVEHAAGDVDPEVADGGRVPAREAPGHGDCHRDPDGGAHELLHGEHADLGEVRHGRLAAVVLPVRVRHERDDRVEAERLRHGPEVLRVERQRPLDPQQQVADGEEHAGEDDGRAGVALPGLLLVGARSEQAVEGSLRPGQEVDAAVEDGGHVRAQVPPGETQGDDQDDDGPEEAHVSQNHSGLNMAMPR